MTKEFYKFSKIQDALFHILAGLDFLIIYDCETTGFKPEENHIIQLSARLCCVMENGFLEEVGQAEWYINPGYCLPDNIVELTGISDDFLGEKPFEVEVFKEIADFFGREAILGYNNHKFDDLFLKNMYVRYGCPFEPSVSIDLYKIIKDVLEPGETENKKLSTVAAYFGFAEDVEQFHNAVSDTKATFFCFNRCLEFYKKIKSI